MTEHRTDSAFVIRTESVFLYAVGLWSCGGRCKGMDPASTDQSVSVVGWEPPETFSRKSCKTFKKECLHRGSLSFMYPDMCTASQLPVRFCNEERPHISRCKTRKSCKNIERSRLFVFHVGFHVRARRLSFPSVFATNVRTFPKQRR